MSSTTTDSEDRHELLSSRTTKSPTAASGRWSSLMDL